jgi:hypothetical protein
MLGFADLADRVRASWEDERNPLTEAEREEWEDTLALDAGELDWLDYFLSSPKVREDALGLEEIDGLFAAVISGPATIAPSKAFATVWGGSDQSPDFDDPEQGQYVLDL